MLLEVKSNHLQHWRYGDTSKSRSTGWLAESSMRYETPNFSLFTISYPTGLGFRSQRTVIPRIRAAYKRRHPQEDAGHSRASADVRDDVGVTRI